MKSGLTILALLLISALSTVHADRNILTSQLTLETLQKAIQPLESFKPFPDIDDRAAWDQLPEKLRARYIREGEKSLTFEWPSLPAATYLEYARVGNRSNYQNIANRRRRALTNLVMAALAPTNANNSRAA